MSKVAKDKNVIGWILLAFAVILSFYPYEFQDSLFPFLQNELYSKILYIVVLFSVLATSAYSKSIPTILLRLAAVHFIGFLILFIVHGGVGQYLGEYVTILLVLLLISTIEAKIGLRRFFEIYNKWILLMAVGGCIALVLAMMGVSPIQTFINSRDTRMAYSWGVSFTNEYYDNFIRYAGYFDEPGAMGYWMVFAIAINRLFIKIKWIEWGLLVLGLFSFSFGYIVQVIIFLFLFTITNKKASRSITITAAVALIGFGLYSTRNSQYSFFYDASYGRYETINRSEQIMGGREEMSMIARKFFLEEPVFGMGRVQFEEQPYYMQDNPYETLAKDGIVGTIFLYYPFILLLYWAIKRRDGELFRVWIFMVASFMHRPFHSSMLYYFIFYSIVYMYYLKMKRSPQLYGKTS